MTETQLKAEIQKALDQLGIPRWRMQAGGYRGRMRGLPKGTFDILAAPQIPYAGFPAFLWIEVKKPKEKLRPEQEEFSVRMMAQGHYCIVVRSVDDLLDWLKERKAS